MIYELGEVIGAGGMGEVIHGFDRGIGRDVAIKRLRKADPTPSEIEAFLREARIQARLEHPAIVPVYELGKDDEGRPYFAMKRLVGTTLREFLANPTAQRQRLLRAFADVCRAIDYAHSRGVVHRDLKPSNIILGEFGESYILDWGVAAIVDADPPPLVGTPGYMAPEQLESNAYDPPVDVFALGTMLHELLGQSPPPELEALCAAARGKDPSVRPTARRMADRIEAFLDGDRDLVRRQQLADDLVWTARAALDDGRRAEAMHAAGRALALHPEGAAAEVVTSILLEPPRDAPPELSRAIADADAIGVRKHARTAIVAYLVLASFLPVAMWNGIRDWGVVLGMFASAIVMAVMAWRIYVRPHRTLVEMLVYATANAFLLVMLSRMAGPFTFVPGLVCFMTMSTMSYPAFVKRSWALVATMVVGFATPIILERVGALRKTWELVDGGLCSHAGALQISGTPTVTLVIGASVATIVMAGVHSAAIAKANRAAEIRLVSQAWHLSQLLPKLR